MTADAPDDRKLSPSFGPPVLAGAAAALALGAAATAWAGLPSMITGGLALASATLALGVRVGRLPPRLLAKADNISLVRVESPDFALLLDALPLKALVARSDRTVIAVNPKARIAFPGLALDMPLSLALRDPDLLAAFDASAQDGTPRSVEWTERGPGERSYRVSFAAIPERIVVVFESLEEVRAADRMRVDFIANASHELRTPLASLLGFIETLQGPARDDPAAHKRFLGIMQEQALRMSRLVDDLLSLSRIEQRAHQVPSESVDLTLVIDETLDVLRQRAADLDVSLSFAHPKEPTIIAGDRDELLRLADNLVENAIKYGRSGGRVEVNLARVGERVVLDVRDFGPGIPPEHLPRLTERFYRVDAGKSRESGGTGLGLALVKHIAQRHRARLAITNAEGGGARVTVSFGCL